MLNFVDDYSGMAWIYLLKKKSDTFASFQEWRPLSKTKLANTSRYSVQTMGESTHLSLFHVTCATRVSPPDHFTTYICWKQEIWTPTQDHHENCARAIHSDSNFPQYCGAKPWRPQVIWKTTHLPGHWQTKLLLNVVWPPSWCLTLVQTGMQSLGKYPWWKPKNIQLVYQVHASQLLLITQKHTAAWTDPLGAFTSLTTFSS